MMSAGAQSFLAGLMPDPELSVSEWSDQYRYLTSTSASEPGLYKTSRVPFNKEIMDCLSVNNPCREIIVMKGAQLGLSEVGNNWLGYIMDCVPGPVLAVQPTVELAKNYSKMRVDTLIDNCPTLQGKVSEAKSRDSSNTILTKEFKGGILVIGGGNSAAGLRSMPVRYLFLDEIDSYKADVGGEGSAISLAEARTATYANKKKIYKISTPTIDGRSAIQAEFARSSQERYHVPCPHCEAFQTIEWAQMRYEPDNIFDTVHLECIQCKGKIYNHDKTFMLEHGKWIAENPKEEFVRGFHISSLYSPVGWYSWAEGAVDYEAARTDPARLKTFTNTKLGLTFRESGETPDFQRLYERREGYTPRMLPTGAIMMTAGIDVQKDRVEVMLVGWGKKNNKWLIDYAVIQGDIEQQDVWDELEEYLNTEWPVFGSNKRVPVTAFCIDSGYATLRVAAFAKRFNRKRCYMIKGISTGSVFVGKPRDLEIKANGKKVKTGLRIWNVLGDIAKSELFRQLLLPMPEDGKPYPQGYFHFYRQLNLEWFKGLCSEELKSKKVKGFDVYFFEKVYRRNEPLDTYVYARACMNIIGADRWSDARWDTFEEDLDREDQILDEHLRKQDQFVIDAVAPPVVEMVDIEKPAESAVTQPIKKKEQAKPDRRRSSFW